MGLFKNVIGEVKEGVSEVGQQLLDELVIQIRMAVAALGAGLLLLFGIVGAIADLSGVPTWAVSLILGGVGLTGFLAWKARPRPEVTEAIQNEAREALGEMRDAAMGVPEGRRGAREKIAHPETRDPGDRLPPPQERH